MSSKLTVHSSNGTDLGEIDLASWSERKTGFGLMRIKRTDLLDVLLEATEKAGITIHYDKRLVAVEESAEGVSVTFSDGSTDTADLLLGCDGIHSSVRTLHVDQNTVPEYSGISGIFSLLPTSELTPSASSVSCLNATLTPDGLFVLMPCTPSGDGLFWFFSYEVPIPASGDTRDGWEEHRKKEVERFKTNLFDILHGVQGLWGHLLRDVVSQTKVVKFYPVFRLPLGGSWSTGNCLLLGDAAHAMQPHAGQGVSMALEDVFLLSRLLESSYTSTSDIFAKYDEIRRPRIEKIYKTATSNADRRKKTSPWRLWIMECIMWIGLKGYKYCRLDRWGIGQKDLVYDIEQAEI